MCCRFKDNLDYKVSFKPQWTVLKTLSQKTSRQIINERMYNLKPRNYLWNIPFDALSHQLTVGNRNLRCENRDGQDCGWAPEKSATQGQGSFENCLLIPFSLPAVSSHGVYFLQYFVNPGCYSLCEVWLIGISSHPGLCVLLRCVLAVQRVWIFMRSICWHLVLDCFWQFLCWQCSIQKVLVYSSVLKSCPCGFLYKFQHLGF